jgi:hypothetical protein
MGSDAVDGADEASRPRSVPASAPPGDQDAPCRHRRLRPAPAAITATATATAAAISPTVRSACVDETTRRPPAAAELALAPEPLLAAFEKRSKDAECRGQGHEQLHEL